MEDRSNNQSNHAALTHRVMEAIRSLRFGSVEIIVHDGRVVGLERREKLRFDKDLGR